MTDLRILCLNPNTTAFVTEAVAAEMRTAVQPGTRVCTATASFGPAVIRTHFDHAVATHAAVDLAARHARGMDAVLVAASFDPATEALREVLGIPVIGISEASIAMARMLGRRIGYVTAGAASTPLYRDTLRRYDIDRDLSGWRVVEAPGAYGPGDQSGITARIAAASAELAAEGAEAVVILGAVLAGVARRIGSACPVPLVDGGLAGGLMAEAMARMGPLPARRREPNPMTGIGADLAALAGGDDSGAG